MSMCVLTRGRGTGAMRPRTRAGQWLALMAGAVVAVASVPTQALADEVAAAGQPSTRRPRIGLALGGGGAKGAAHVGVITLLEDMRIPIDCVVGTSMGALVGGTYATGMSGAQLEKAIGEISWAETIAFQGRREKLPMRRKLAGRTYSNSLEFGFRDGAVTAPPGFINTQNVEQTIRYLVAPSLGTNRFDDLPIPFRAIATDMMTGEMVVLDRGNLAQAMRASMAVPGVFSPVTIDGRTLGDGGLTRNVPVDIARQTCADVVIAVAVPTPPPPPEALQSPLTMISRTLEVLIGANEREQLATLRPGDVKIVVPMGDIGSGSFDRVADAIPLGRRAAEEHREELRRYSLPAGEYQAWRASTRRPETDRVEIGAIRIAGLERVDETYVRAHIGLQPGDRVDERALAQAMNRVFDLGDFESVQYDLEDDPQHPTLRVDVAEKSVGPNILRFDLGLEIGTESGNAFVLSADYLRPWINSLGGEVHGQVQVGRNSRAQLSLYQPLDVAHAWFVEPGAKVQRTTEDIYVDGNAATRYNFDGGYGYLEGGRTFGTRSELRLGLRSGVQAASREIAYPGLSDLDAEGYGGATLQFTYDDRDRDFLATRGWLGRLDYYHAFEALGSAAPQYGRLEAMLEKAIPVHADMLQLRGAGGARFEGALPFYDYFTLGGPISFPGLSLGQLRGTSYWTVSSTYLHKVADISLLFGQSLYAGGGLSVGDMAGRIDGIEEAPIVSGSLVFGGRTPLGPVALSFATTSTNDWSVLFTLGRPVEEGNITDSDW
ncbi:MAG TPA: patatin-like phospholipase family protein [Steroidobacteraceae bacterium]